MASTSITVKRIVGYFFQCTYLSLRYQYQGNASNQIETITSETRASPKMNGVEESVFVVEVDKSAGSLGLRLEGGSDAGGDVKIKSIKVRLMPSVREV